MRIDYLVHHPSLVDQLVALHHAEWGYLRPTYTMAQWGERMRARCGIGGVPTAVVALDDDGLCGSAFLVAQDVDDRPDLTPWLAGVYVLPGKRGRGIATALVGRVAEDASLLGHRALYLYTVSATALYARLGWKTYQSREYLGEQITIMVRQLAA
jgi:GNAT superfamily N-acetyltransferase